MDQIFYSRTRWLQLMYFGISGFIGINAFFTGKSVESPVIFFGLISSLGWAAHVHSYRLRLTRDGRLIETQWLKPRRQMDVDKVNEVISRVYYASRGIKIVGPLLVNRDHRDFPRAAVDTKLVEALQKFRPELSYDPQNPIESDRQKTEVTNIAKRLITFIFLPLGLFVVILLCVCAEGTRADQLPSYPKSALMS